jgi:MinD superfamily P-loop ATPase
MTEAPDILLEFQRNDRGALEAQLRAAGAVFKGTAIKCPFHDDRTPSASVYEKDGVWRFKCHGCGVCEDIIGVQALAAGRKSADVLREARQQAKPPEPKRPPRIFPTVDALKRRWATSRRATSTPTRRPRRRR